MQYTATTNFSLETKNKTSATLWQGSGGADFMSSSKFVSGLFVHCHLVKVVLCVANKIHEVKVT